MAWQNLRKQYGCGPVEFTGTDNALYERHLVFDNVVKSTDASPRDRFEAFARSVRDILSQRWVRTEDTYEQENPKRVYYLSMEFLIGRSLANNVTNLLLDPLAKPSRQAEGSRLAQPARAGARCRPGQRRAWPPGGVLPRFDGHDATAGHRLRPALRVWHVPPDDRDGWQNEQPDNWLRCPDPWEVARPQEQVEVKLNCSFEVSSGSLRAVAGKPSSLIGIPFDRPVVGYGGKTINTLRLWTAAAPDFFDFQEFSHGDFVGALAETLAAESLTRVLYPDDSTSQGQGLRFVQEYFLVACSLADIIRRFRRNNADWNALPEKIAIQLNDTHPSMAVPELMRILLDEAHLGWDQAWDLTQRTLAYTNHTLLPEALEKWPVAWFEMMLPRHLEIIFEINRRLLDDVRQRFPGDEDRVARVSLIEEGPTEQCSHGEPGHRRLAQHEWRGRDSLQAAAHCHG